MYKKRGIILVFLVLSLLVTLPLISADVFVNTDKFDRLYLGNWDNDVGCDGGTRAVDQDNFENINVAHNVPPGYGCSWRVCEKDKGNPDDCMSSRNVPTFQLHPYAKDNDNFKKAGRKYSDIDSETGKISGYGTNNDATSGVAIGGYVGAGTSAALFGTAIAINYAAAFTSASIIGLAATGIGAILAGALGLGLLIASLIMDDDAEDQLCKDFYYGGEPPKSYICSTDNYWYGCSLSDEPSDNGQGSVIWVDTPDGALYYNCTNEMEGAYPIWEQVSIDADKDGYTINDGDCADFPSKLQPYGCPTIDKQTGEIPCEYPLHSQCAICINPGAPETCGDGLNNDCGGPDPLFRETIDYIEPESTTPDDCNYFKEGCEQQPIFSTSNDPVANGTLESTASHRNIYNEQFSWIQTGLDNEGYCCGYNGVTDIGNVEGDKTNNVNHVCMYRDDYIVGREKDFEEWGACTNSGDSASDCISSCEDWCWIRADGGEKYNVFTIKIPGQEPYDIVSDGFDWQTCDASYGEGPIKLTPNAYVEKDIANHFYCYQEGNHWSWAECYGPGDHKYNLNVKGRLAGDAPYSLYLKDANENGELFHSPIVITSEQGAYKNFYKTSTENKPSFDFTNYDQLAFFVKFIDQSGIELSVDDLKLPVELYLRIYGPVQEGPQPILYEQNVLGDVTNGPIFSEDNWMHIVASIPDNLKSVSHIEISVGKTTQNDIKVRNVYLSKSGQTSPICSGRDDAEYSSWLSSFDDASSISYINAEDMCKENFGENAWLGDETMITDSVTANCCGNNPEEYHLGTSVFETFN